MSRSRLTNFLRLKRIPRRRSKNCRRMNYRRRKIRRSMKNLRPTNYRRLKTIRSKKNLRSMKSRLNRTNCFPKILRSTSRRLTNPTNCFPTKSFRLTNYCRLKNYRSTNRCRTRAANRRTSRRRCRNRLSAPEWPVCLCLRIRLSSRRRTPNFQPPDSARLLFRPLPRRPIFRACLL